MMSSMMGFEVLPALNEGDERICLADILMLRDSCLSDRELWAVCMETCIGIQDVNSSEMFQTLCITPESLAFDSSGAACFLDLATDPETMYIPPEYESVGNSYKAHLYSLGMTMLFAAEYNAGESDAEQVGMGEELSGLVSRMTADEYDERASLPAVMQLCVQHLNGKNSQRLCKEMAAIAKLDDSSPESDDSSSSSYDEDSPVPKSKVFSTKVPDKQSMAAVIDLQNDLQRVSNDLPPSSSLTTVPALHSNHDNGKNTSTSNSGATSGSGAKLASDATSGTKTGSGATSGSPGHAVPHPTSGAISPPAAFRNSAEDYKHALVDSPMGAVTQPVPAPSPPKVSRMMALLDNGEIKSLDLAAVGSEIELDNTAGEGTSGTTPTPPLATVSSPVPTCELGASQNSAFQVVWSPRSSKTTSPIPASPSVPSVPSVAAGGMAGQDIGVVTTASAKEAAVLMNAVGLQALADPRNANYTNLLSVALNNGSQDREASPTLGTDPASATLPTPVIAVTNSATISKTSSNVAKTNSAIGHNDGSMTNNHRVRVDNDRADTDLKSVKNKLDELMAKYGQKLSPRRDLVVGRTSAGNSNRTGSECTDSSLTVVTKPQPLPAHHDLPELVKHSYLQQQQQKVDNRAGGQCKGDNSNHLQSPTVPPPSPGGPPGGGPLTQLRARRDDLDFEFGDCISPVPTFVRRASGGSSPSGSSEAETDSLHEGDDAEDKEDSSEISSSERLARRLHAGKLRVSVVKLKPGSDESQNEDEDGIEQRKTHITAGQLRRLGQASTEANPLTDLVEEDEEEEEDERTEKSESKSHPPSERVHDLSLSDDDHGDDSRSTAEFDITNDSDATACSDIEHDDHSSLASDSEVDEGMATMEGSLEMDINSGSTSEGINPSDSVVTGGTTDMLVPASHAQRAMAVVVGDGEIEHGDSGAGAGGGEAGGAPPQHHHPAVPGGSHAASPDTHTNTNTGSLPVVQPSTNRQTDTNPPLPEISLPHSHSTSTDDPTSTQDLTTTSTDDPGVVNNTLEDIPSEEDQEEDGEEEERPPLEALEEEGIALHRQPHSKRGQVATVVGVVEGGGEGESLPKDTNTGSIEDIEGDSDSSCSDNTASTAPLLSPEPEDTKGEALQEGEEGEEEEEQSERSDSSASHTSSCTSEGSSSEEEEEDESEPLETSSLKEPVTPQEGQGPRLADESLVGVPGVGEEGEVEEEEEGKDGKINTSDSKTDSDTQIVPEVTARGSTESAPPVQESSDKEEEKTTHKGVTSEEKGEEKEGGKDKESEDQDTVDMSARGMMSRLPTSGSKGGGYGEPDRQTQTVQEMLEKLGCGLQETELWALCRECVQALSRYRYDLPAYISLETVFIEEGGEIGYQSVPDDRELEVVYLAPELQQHGVVTEKTCLFGIAALLWSAADYKLPQNQEPALSEQLENLLMSMTQDNQDLRPQVTDVLQVCSEFDRRHDIRSRTICQGLYSDAQKAEHFGKDNALVRDIITDDVKHQQASRHHDIVNCIKITAELQSQLKPVAERQLAEKPVVRTLHDKLMDEILNPAKKLRKSSKPKVVDVRDIFINNPELMADLRRVVGGAPHLPVTNSAFMPRQPMKSVHAQQRALQQQGITHHVPNAFQSTATHFSPIIVSANGQQQVAKPQIRSNDGLYVDKEKKVAKKMRELKKNLLKTRPALNIAQDVEKDALQDGHINMAGYGHLQNHVQQHPQIPHLGQLSPGTVPPQGHHIPGQQPAGLVNGQVAGQLPGQLPGQMPGAQAGGSQAGLFPFQVQLQQDPRTGLFQLIPVAVDPAQGQQQPQQIQQQQQQQQQQSVYGSTHSPQNSQVDAVMEAQEMANQIQRESQERRRYLKHTEEELRARVKSDNTDQRSRSSASSSSRSSEKRPEHKVKSRSRDKDGHHRTRSHTVASSDFKDDLARATNNVRSRAKEQKHSHSESNLKKSNSEENILGKMDKPSSSRSRAHRSESARTRLKRAKSGSSLDYRGLDVKVKDIQLEDPSSANYNRQRNPHRDSSGAHLSKSQQHLDLDLPQDDVRRSRDGAGQGRRTRTSHDESHIRSPLGEVGVSPPPSPSLSKDSGVSGLNMKSSGEMILMERLLNSDTIRHQQRLSKVICLLRDEFAFDGYMENGVEDFAMAEYILSLGNLKWDTFNNAVTEKYCDLFWQDELLTGLYEAVNGTRPIIEKRVTSNPKLTSPRSSTNEDPQSHQQQHPQHQSTHRPAAQRTRVSSPKPPVKSSPKKPSMPMQPQSHLQQHHQQQQHQQQQQQQQANHMNWNGKASRATHDTITGSAFRPIRAVHPEGSAATAMNPEVFKPKPMMAPSSHTDTSDSTDNEVSHRPRRYRKKPNQLEKGKSMSMHELLLEQEMGGEVLVEDNNNQIMTKSHSQGDLIDNHHPSHHTGMVDTGMDPHRMVGARGGGVPQGNTQQNPSKMGMVVSLDGNKPKVVYIRSSESENDSYESNTNAAYHHHHPQEDGLSQRARHMRAMANSTAGYRTSNSFAYRYDSDSSSTSDRRNEQYNSNSLPFQRHNANRIPQRSHSREDSQSESSRGSSGPGLGRRLMGAKSEGHLNMMSGADEFGSRERVYSGSRRMFRGSVIYYPAEMEHYLRPEIREFAVQVWNRRKALTQDTRTKENIEAKMATLDQEMMMEHRQKKKTLRFYQKLVEANRAGKGGDQKSMMSKVAKQLIEMNTKLEFLDSAKKHLEMLYAEQWGLDHYLLYSLSECLPDEPMLLSACENPHLQYQVVKGAAGGQDSQVLQAGLPEGLMAYLFAQNALSEGYIHQFFYCFRYFLSPAEFLDFLMIKFAAASLSLSPDADVPVKVKARSVDLLQVWIEGYYSIDFKHNPDLTNMLYDFIKEKMVPVEPTAEYLLELLEDAQDDRHIDLHYPQFCVADDFELQLLQAEAPPKKDDKKQPKEWESFKAALHFNAKPQKLRHQMVKARVASLNADRYLSQLEIDKCDHDAYFPRSSMGRLGDTFMLSDYTSVTLAEQLTCMEQELFRQSHPVHYLNSKAQGVGVALTTPAINKAQSMYRLTAAWEDNQESSLFVGTFTTDDIIQRMIEHSQAIAFWVAAEIVCCDSSKAQIAAISKFLTTARLCQEMRNFATCISILDGLENVLVRQVPAWRNLPSKYASIMDELSSIRVFLKSDSMCLLESDDSRSLPTIPCVLLFLLHVQQLEIGGFRLANTMYKWPKMKSISKVIDQIRIFKDHSYSQPPDWELQDLIRQRMRELGQQDLHVLAAQHDTNFQKVPSRNIFKRMKGKMGKSSES